MTLKELPPLTKPTNAEEVKALLITRLRDMKKIGRKVETDSFAQGAFFILCRLGLNCMVPTDHYLSAIMNRPYLSDAEVFPDHRPLRRTEFADLGMKYLQALQESGEPICGVLLEYIQDLEFIAKIQTEETL